MNMKRETSKMIRNVMVGLLVSAAFLGCESKEAEVNPHDLEPKIVLKQSTKGFVINDQHEVEHKVPADTKTLVFAFADEPGHMCNDFFATKGETYLEDNKAMFIADISGAPSIIRSMFIMPGLKDFKHTVLVINDKNVATGFRSGLPIEEIVIVKLDNNIITKISTVTTEEELAIAIEKK